MSIWTIRPFTECLVHVHPVHSDFGLSEPVDCYVNNLENGVILSYINDEIKIVAIRNSVLYNDGNIVIILSTFFSTENDQRKRLSHFCKRYLQYYVVASQARFLSFGHFPLDYTRLHSPTLSLIKFVFGEVIPPSWLLIVLLTISYTFTRSFENHMRSFKAWRLTQSSQKQLVGQKMLATPDWSWPITCLHDKNNSSQSSS